MVYDDLIVGSGLSALAAACGLNANRQICVLGGLPRPAIRYYDAGSGIPCENAGMGGLGAYWHGVIPTTLPWAPSEEERAAFVALFARFYPGTAVDDRFGADFLFVPYRPIRPAKHWQVLLAERGGRLTLQERWVERIERRQSLWEAHLKDGVVTGRRLWLAAGALGTPRILRASQDFSSSVRPRYSDHVIIYLGQLDRRRDWLGPTPSVERRASGVWMRFHSDLGRQGLMTVKPARFDYRELDHGIEQRSAFGLPASGVLKKVARAGSPGLLAESLFNKFGLFPNADVLSAYAQIRVQDAYAPAQNEGELTALTEVIRRTTDAYRISLPWPALIPSRRPDLFVRGIHLHRTVDAALVQAPDLRVIDASALDVIGPEHHSFAVMARAAALAAESE